MHDTIIEWYLLLQSIPKFSRWCVKPHFFHARFHSSQNCAKWSIICIIWRSSENQAIDNLNKTFISVRIDEMFTRLQSETKIRVCIVASLHRVRHRPLSTQVVCEWQVYSMLQFSLSIVLSLNSRIGLLHNLQEHQSRQQTRLRWCLLAEALSTGKFSIEFGVSGTPRQQAYRCKGGIVVVRKCVFVNELLTHRPDYCRVIINSVFHDLQTGIVKTSTPVVTTSKATPQSFLDSYLP